MCERMNARNGQMSVPQKAVKIVGEVRNAEQKHHPQRDAQSDKPPGFRRPHVFFEKNQPEIQSEKRSVSSDERHKIAAPDKVAQKNSQSCENKTGSVTDDTGSDRHGAKVMEGILPAITPTSCTPLLSTPGFPPPLFGRWSSIPGCFYPTRPTFRRVRQE